MNISPPSSTPTVRKITRQEARAAGLSRYFTGRLCRRGHLAERYTSSHHCVACRVEYNRSPTKHSTNRPGSASWSMTNAQVDSAVVGFHDGDFDDKAPPDDVAEVLFSRAEDILLAGGNAIELLRLHQVLEPTEYNLTALGYLDKNVILALVINRHRKERA